MAAQVFQCLAMSSLSCPIQSPQEPFWHWYEFRLLLYVVREKWKCEWMVRKSEVDGMRCLSVWRGKEARRERRGKARGGKTCEGMVNKGSVSCGGVVKPGQRLACLACLNAAQLARLSLNLI